MLQLTKYLKYTISIALLLGISFYFSCAPVYHPNSVFIPMIEEQGELHIAGGVGSNGANLQAGYAVSDHILVMGSLAHSDNNEEGDDERSHGFAEIGAGYHNALSRKARYDVIGGIGWGNTVSRSTFTLGNTTSSIQATGSYRRIFIQPGLGIDLDALRLGFAIRGSYVRLTELISDSNNIDISDGFDGFFMEPALTAAVGWKNIKFFGQAGIAIPTGQDLDFEFQPLIFSFGVHLYLKTNKY